MEAVFEYLKDLGESALILRAELEARNADWLDHLISEERVDQMVYDDIAARLDETAHELVRLIVRAAMQADDGHRLVDRELSDLRTRA